MIFKESVGLCLRAGSKSWQSLALGITASLVAISIHSLADYNLHFMANMFVVVVLVAIVMGKRKPKAAWALAIPCLAAMVAAIVVIVKDAGLDEFGFQFVLLLLGGYFIFFVLWFVERVGSRRS